MGVQNVQVPENGARPRVAMFADAAALKTELALCEVRLFKETELVISPTLTVAALDAVEADYSGYTTGGVTVTAAGDPYLGNAGEVLVSLPSVQFNHVPAVPNVENEIRGAYVVDAAGVLRGVVVFEENQTMAGLLNSVVASITFRVL